MMTDSERLEWLEKHLFYKKWNGVIDSGWKDQWMISPKYRNVVYYFQGQTFREAIDKAQEVFP